MNITISQPTIPMTIPIAFLDHYHSEQFYIAESLVSAVNILAPDSQKGSKSVRFDVSNQSTVL